MSFVMIFMLMLSFLTACNDNGLDINCHEFYITANVVDPGDMIPGYAIMTNYHRVWIEKDKCWTVAGKMLIPANADNDTIGNEFRHMINGTTDCPGCEPILF